MKEFHDVTCGLLLTLLCVTGDRVCGEDVRTPICCMFSTTDSVANGWSAEKLFFYKGFIGNSCVNVTEHAWVTYYWTQWVFLAQTSELCIHDSTLQLSLLGLCVGECVTFNSLICLGCFRISLRCFWLQMWWYVQGSVCMSVCLWRGNVPAFTLCQRKSSFWLQWGGHQKTSRRQSQPSSQVRTWFTHV